MNQHIKVLQVAKPTQNKQNHDRQQPKALKYKAKRTTKFPIRQQQTETTKQQIKTKLKIQATEKANKRAQTKEKKSTNDRNVEPPNNDKQLNKTSP